MLHVWANVSGDCRKGIGRELLFEAVSDMGDYHHNYFIHSSSLSTNNTLSLCFKSHIPVLNLQGILDFHCQHVGIFDSLCLLYRVCSGR